VSLRMEMEVTYKAAEDNDFQLELNTKKEQEIKLKYDTTVKFHRNCTEIHKNATKRQKVPSTEVGGEREGD